MKASEDNRNQLIGVWRVVSVQIRDEDTGEMSDLHGPDPRGFAVFSPEGRLAIIFTASGRTLPANEGEAAALFRDMSAYTGRFILTEDQIVTEVDVAWHPAWDNSQQPRFYKLEGDRLTLSTGVQDHPSRPGVRLRGFVVWTRER